MFDWVESVYQRHVSIRLSVIVLMGLLVCLGVVGYFYATGDVGTKIGSLLGGLLATFIAVLIQFLLTMAHYREIERLKRMGFRDILPHRKQRREYYAELLRSARKRIDFIGKTAHSFLDDFAYEGEGGSETDRLIIDALERAVTIRILVAQREDLPAAKQVDHDESVARMTRIAEQYEHFSFGFLTAPPTQTWVLTDRRCVFGPVFPTISSRITPAIHADSDSPFLDRYHHYFQMEWEQPESEVPVGHTD